MKTSITNDNLDFTEFFENHTYILKEVLSNIEDILIVVKDCGAYQIKTLMFLSLIFGFSTVYSVMLPFFTLNPDYLCKPKYTYINSYIPCNHDSICNNSFDKIRCPDDNRVTWIEDFDLLCDKENIIVVSGLTYFVGMMVSNLFLPHLCETYGRKLVLIGSITVYIINHIILMIISFPIYLAVYSFVGGITYSGVSITCFLLTFEYASKSKKTLFSLLLTSALNFGALIQIALFYLFENWRICITVNIITYAIILYYSSTNILETPSYLLLKQDFCSLLDNFILIAKANRHEEFLYDYLNEMINEKRQIMNEVITIEKISKLNVLDFKRKICLMPDSRKDNTSIYDIFKYASQRNKLLKISFSWFAVNIINYGIIFNLKQFGGNIYVSAITLYFAFIISFLLSNFTFTLLGTKYTIMAYYFICVLSNFIMAFFSQYIGFFNKILLFAAGFTSCSIGAGNYIYTADLFAQKYRVTAISFCSIVSRFGGIFASFIMNFPFHQSHFYWVLGLLTISLFYNLTDEDKEVIPELLEKEHINVRTSVV